MSRITSLDPKQTIMAYLTSARETTLQFLTQRNIPHYQLHAVTYQDEMDQLQICILFVVQDASGFWSVSSACYFPPESTRIGNKRWMGHPQANLSGWHGSDYFCAFGEVIDQKFEVTHVRLASINGIVLEEPVEAGYVLFLSEQVLSKPIEAGLYNCIGKLVGRHPVFYPSSFFDLLLFDMPLQA
jgi:hypothetical protein